MNKTEFFLKIAHELTDGEAVFPTSTQIALKLRKALDDPDCPVELAAKLVTAEPLLASSVVKIANAVAYNRSGREITDTRNAIQRIGFSTLRSLATALLTRQLAADSPTTRTLSNQLWEHTTQVASLASALARHVTHINPETAMFAAIVHEIGGFYLLSRAEKMPEILDGEFAEWIETGETEVGRAMLKNLGIPNSIVEAMEDVWAGYLSMPPVTLADTLLLADELASTPSPLHQPGYRGASDARAAELEMLINQETLSHILAEAAEEVNSLNQALRF